MLMSVEISDLHDPSRGNQQGAHPSGQEEEIVKHV
jgi:hypothetical protein